MTFEFDFDLNVTSTLPVHAAPQRRIPFLIKPLLQAKIKSYFIPGVALPTRPQKTDFVPSTAAANQSH